MGIILHEMTRTEKDSLGPIEIPDGALWGPVTERSRGNFPYQEHPMPAGIIWAMAHIKRACALANKKFGKITPQQCEAIVSITDEILAGDLEGAFPLSVYQTGSGTHTNMNLNEVIANRAHLKSGGKLEDTKKLLHPNDHVNASQSSNDTMSTALHVSLYHWIETVTLPGLERLRDSLGAKSQQYADTKKIGRTHMMDAVPMTVGAEIGAWASQLDRAIDHVRETAQSLRALPIGGTAIGAGTNAPEGFAKEVILELDQATGYMFVPSADRYALIAAHDRIGMVHGALRSAAVVLHKIADDIRLLASGPRCGIGELVLPANEPGSSIMPGKVNPSQCESLTQICLQVIGNDTTITMANLQGHLQLNLYKPLIAHNALESADLLGRGAGQFAQMCTDGMTVDTDQCQAHLENSLMLVTALAPHIGYDHAAQIAHQAHASGQSLREAAISSGISAQDYDAWVGQIL